MESSGVDWKIGGLEETGRTKLVLGWEAGRVGSKEFGIHIRGNVAKSGGTTKRVSGVWVKLNKRWVHFQGTRNLEIK